MLETEMLDDYIDNKLKALCNGKFNVEIYFQGVNEIIFFYYLYSGIRKANREEEIIEIRYESFSITNPKKKLEYTFLFYSGVAVCTEIKTITCDPYCKEKLLKVVEGKYIKKYFHNFELSEIQNLQEYNMLENSTHDRQLRKNI